MKKFLYIIAGILITSSALISQEGILDSYISEGLESNLALRQKQLDYAISLARLKESRALFFPEAGINARYTVASGGRVIEFPVGDLLNPVYSTLNMLTGAATFPAIENQSFSFYRPHEQETKLSFVQPVFNPDIIYNYRINKEAAEIARVDIEIYRRELTREIKKSYYNAIKAVSLLNLADSAILLVEENLRVSRSLFENDMITIDAVYRSETELSKVKAQRSNAEKMVVASGSYFNFLLNRDLESQVDLSDDKEISLLTDLDASQEMALAQREELEKIKHYLKMNRYALKLEKGDKLPELFGVVDYGFQGEEYSFTRDDDFVLASLVLRWNLFHGLKSRYRIDQREIENEKLELAGSEAEQAIKMEVLNNYYALMAAASELSAANKQKQSAHKAYNIIRRKFSEGQAGLLELIDARTAVTEAGSACIIARCDYFLRRADMECATGEL